MGRDYRPEPFVRMAPVAAADPLCARMRKDSCTDFRPPPRCRSGPGPPRQRCRRRTPGLCSFSLPLHCTARVADHARYLKQRRMRAAVTQGSAAAVLVQPNNAVDAAVLCANGGQSLSSAIPTHMYASVVSCTQLARHHTTVVARAL